MVFRKEHLCRKLAAIYNFGYCNAAGKCEDDFLFRFSRDFKEKVLNRIGVLFDAANHIIIEENYVEREWKEMIARHYLHSAYANALREKVIRVHFLEQEEFCDENYLGYITLRPIEELAISLSFIYINWKKCFWHGETSYVMTYEKEVHYMGKTLKIDTYPFFSQDSIVTCCADANLIMLTKYFANRYKNVPISSMELISRNSGNRHSFPKKIGSALLENMLEELNIPYRVQRFKNVKCYKDESWDRVQKNIDTYIESGLPVILGLEGHVVQLIGHLGMENGEQKKYIVYDDSGHLEKISVFDIRESCNRFLYTLSVKELRDYFAGCQNGRDSFFILTPEHERVYIDFERYQLFLAEYLYQYAVLDKKGSIVCQMFDEESNLSEEVALRNILVDNSILKSFVKGQKNDIQRDCIEELLKKDLPHFLWYTEIEVGDDIVCTFADPTMYYKTGDLEKVFFKCPPIALIDSCRLSLLTEGASKS